MKKWIPLLAFQTLFLLTAFMITLIHVEHIYDGSNKANPPYSAANNAPASNANVPANTTPDKPESKKKSIEQHDLEAQQRMAQEADEMSVLVYWQNKIAGFGLLLVLITTVFAGLAWRASREAVEVARKDSGSKRAWVCLDTIQAVQNHGDQDQVISIDFNPVLNNSGETPALNLSAKCNLSVKPTLAEAIKEINDSDKSNKDFPMMIAPKTDAPLTGSKLTGTQIKKINSGHVCVFYIRIKYTDVFDHRIEHSTESYRELKLSPLRDVDDLIIGIKSTHKGIIEHPDLIT